jgi:hypothetical protein
MAQPIVLVTFYSRCGSTEKLALAAAVGAVQARALIRLRRVPDSSPEKTFEQFPECIESLARMHREYVAPSVNDFLGADAIIFATPDDCNASSTEWSDCLRLLAQLRSQRKLERKAGAVIHAGNESTVRSFSGVLMELGLTTLSADSSLPEAAGRARALGHSVANLARALKQDQRGEQ